MSVVNEKTQEETKIDSEKPKFKISTTKINFRPNNQIYPYLKYNSTLEPSEL
jgi:hypothetical protein